MTTTDMTACGTYAGYQRHKRAHTEPCPDCRAANAAWTREYRARTGATTYTDTSKARARARRRLAEMYPTVYLALIAEERALLREVDS